MFNSFRFFILVALFLTSFSSAGDFRDNDWGAAPYEVIAVEGMGTIGETTPRGGGKDSYIDCINYSGDHLGVQAAYGFIFTPEEKLGIGLCFPRDADICSFYHWEEALSASYGEPDNRDEILTDDESILKAYYQSNARAVEEGVLNGYFALIRYWGTEKTHIWLAAEIVRDGLMVYLKYHSKEYFDLYRDEEEKGKPGPRRGLPPWFDD